jgi:hypothetical protein
MMYFGIEQEIPLLRDEGTLFVDYSNTTHEELQAVVDELPFFKEDYPRLRIGDLGIKRKRWYVEGYERFDGDGKFLKSLPKSLEIRTTPHGSAEGALHELRESYEMLVKHLAPHGFATTWVSFNPFHSDFIPNPPLNAYEKRMRAGSPESRTAEIAELTYGPDLSVSFSDFDDAAIIDAGKKLTFYSPYIIPFSFSSPFKDGVRWDGLSARTFLRTGARPVAMVFLRDNANMIVSRPSLTQPSRTPFEAGRIEFKAFDSCRDLALYRSLFALLRGIIMDAALSGRALVPDAEAHQRSARLGFEDEKIKTGAREVLAAARGALGDPSEVAHLDILDAMLERNTLPVYALIKSYENSKSVIKTLQSYGNLAV